MSPDRSPNFRGARDMGVSSNGGYEALLAELIAGNFAGAYVVGEDLIATAAQPDKVRAALGKLPFVVVQDSRVTETTKLAHVVLPGTHFGEKDGTYTNRKGRVQKLNAAVIPPEGALQDSEIFMRLLDLAGERNGYASPAEIFKSLAREIASYRELDFDAIGDQGIEVGAAVAERHDR
jgi:predicted molibdopterin-dependent oxidoreductase YjgC